MNAAEIKPPFLLTPAHYTNWMPFIAVTDERKFEIRCKETPVKGITITTGLIALVFAGFYWMMAVKAPGAIWAIVVIGALTLIGTPTAIFLYHQHEQKRGPVLIYEKAEGVIELPRDRKRFALKDIASLAVIAAAETGDWVCQLQLIAHTGERFLLVPAYLPAELESILRELRREIQVPIQWFRQKKKELVDETAASMKRLSGS